jgi:hypothetical protein
MNAVFSFRCVHATIVAAMVFAGVRLCGPLPAAFGQPGGAPRFDPAGLELFTAGKPYLGEYETGLYPGGVNEMPAEHRRAGERVAAGIRPLDAEGKPSENGWIAGLIFGHSNARQYFMAIQDDWLANRDALHPRLEILNAATAAQQLPEIRRLEGVVWDRADRLLRQPGYRRKPMFADEPLTRRQVQVLFLHTTFNSAGSPTGQGPPPPKFPDSMRKMQEDMAAVLEHCVNIYPNLRIAYLTCDGLRHYTGMEPHVWREAFALKWLIESQIRGEPGTEFEDRPGRPRRLPYLCWGPYIWDNAWDRSYFTDGVHPAPKALEIVAAKYREHLRTDSIARPWMFRPGEAP